MAIRNAGREPEYYYKSELPISMDKFAQIAIRNDLPIHKLKAIIADYHSYIKASLKYDMDTFELGDICVLTLRGVVGRRYGYVAGYEVVDGKYQKKIKSGYTKTTYKIKADIKLNMLRYVQGK